MEQEPKVYCVGNFTVTDSELMARYVELAMPIVQSFGGKLLCSDQNLTRLEGDPQSVLAVLELPSMKAAEAFWRSPDYAAIKQMRIDATTGGFLVFAKGLPIG
jgi:uncharacterized protein (DUF1330 family)